MNNPSKAKITFATGVGTVTGANFLLESSAGTKILIDCAKIEDAVQACIAPPKDTATEVLAK